MGSILHDACEVVVDIPMTIGGDSVPDNGIHVIPVDLTAATRSQLYLMWKRDGDRFTFFISGVKGFHYSEVNLSAVLTPLGTIGGTTPFNFVADPALVSIRYFWLNGDEVPVVNAPFASEAYINTLQSG